MAKGLGKVNNATLAYMHLYFDIHDLILMHFYILKCKNENLSCNFIRLFKYTIYFVLKPLSYQNYGI